MPNEVDRESVQKKSLGFWLGRDIKSGIVKFILLVQFTVVNQQLYNVHVRVFVDKKQANWGWWKNAVVKQEKSKDEALRCSQSDVATNLLLRGQLHWAWPKREI